MSTVILHLLDPRARLVSGRGLGTWHLTLRGERRRGFYPVLFVAKARHGTAGTRAEVRA
jgi:hypothetical protein